MHNSPSPARPPSSRASHVLLAAVNHENDNGSVWPSSPGYMYSIERSAWQNPGWTPAIEPRTRTPALRLAVHPGRNKELPVNYTETGTTVVHTYPTCVLGLGPPTLTLEHRGPHVVCSSMCVYGRTPPSRSCCVPLLKTFLNAKKGGLLKKKGQLDVSSTYVVHNMCHAHLVSMSFSRARNTTNVHETPFCMYVM